MLRGALRLGFGTATLLTGSWLVRALHGAPAALGAGPLAIRAVAERSPNYHDGAFANLDQASTLNIDREQQRLLLFEFMGARAAGRPPAPVPVVSPPAGGARNQPGELAVTWYGHSTTLVDVDGYRVLTDPIWSDRCSPSDVVGPQRMHPPPAPVESLPAIDAVVISHDHYDHLDIDTVIALARTQRAPFFVPLGVGAHLREWGIPEQRIVELDWGESGRVGELTLVCTPARHFSGRFLARNTTQWASWVLSGPRHRAYFGGDSGYTKSFAQIGSDHGPFGLTLLPVGAYNDAWPDIHMNPEEAVRAHQDLTESGLLLPIHWATFRLAPHPWAEPAERLLTAAEPAGVAVVVPKPGQLIDATDAPEPERWWLRR
jgi:L-ascorbate metabolism protein UlaG (beta-lactamase superfamily)